MTKDEIDLHDQDADRGQEGRPVPRLLEGLQRERQPDGLGRGRDPVDVVAGRHRGALEGHRLHLPAAEGRLSRLGRGLRRCRRRSRARRLDAAYEFVNWFLDGWAGAYLNRQGYYSAVLETAKAKMEPYEWAYWMEGKPADAGHQGAGRHAAREGRRDARRRLLRGAHGRRRLLERGDGRERLHGPEVERVHRRVSLHSTAPRQPRDAGIQCSDAARPGEPSPAPRRDEARSPAAKRVHGEPRRARSRRASGRLPSRAIATAPAGLAAGAPFALVFALFFVVPLLLTVMVSFWDYSEYELIPAFTLRNYVEIFDGCIASFAELCVTLKTYLVDAASSASRSGLITLVLGFAIAYFLAFHVRSPTMQIAAVPASARSRSGPRTSSA